MLKFSKPMLLAALMLGGTGVARADLLVNGNFEASTSQTTTPPGWFNIGHQDGVIAYAVFGTPAYDGDYFYDLGGFGGAEGPIGDGIAQSFATIAGQTYTVTFGLSSENLAEIETLTVAAGNASVDYVLTVDGQGAALKPFVTKSFDFVATGALTTLSFIHTAGQGGNNDPLIDGVSVALAGAVPEPGTWALMLLGVGAVGVLRRRRHAD